MSVLHDLWRFCLGERQIEGEREAAHDNAAWSGPVYRTHTEPAQVPVELIRLQSGSTYTADHRDTRTIRNKLSAYDAHMASEGALTQQEYALYRLQEKRLDIPLIALRMTPLGRWHTVLKGQPRVAIGVTPYTDAIMEWSEHGSDRLAWVTAVTPDETVTIGTVALDGSGVYSTNVLAKSQ